MKRYDKLVRDRIPEIILEKDGIMPKTRIIEDDDEFCALLCAKLKEEVDEFLADPSKEELADILEVIESFFGCKIYDQGEVQEIKERKAWERGGFTKRIFLEEA